MKIANQATSRNRGRFFEYKKSKGDGKMDEERREINEQEGRDAQEAQGAAVEETHAEVAQEADGAPDGGESAEDGKGAELTEAGEGESAAPEQINTAAEADAKIAWLSTELLTAKATAAATALGVRPEKVKYVLKLSELSGIDISDKDAYKRISAAVKQVISELPELKGEAANTTGTQGYFARQASVPMTAFERGFMNN